MNIKEQMDLLQMKEITTERQKKNGTRIFRLPNTGAGDSNIEDDIYVAVMGGGYGGRDDKVGSALFVINLEDNVTPGKLEKVIPIKDEKSLNIVNSVPGTPVVVTADQARGIKYKGALVYVNDFEGKITKFNLIDSWVVRQFKNEYNPIHWHSGHISGVGYLKVPKLIFMTTLHFYQ